MADEYLSGDVRAKLRMAQFAAETNPEFVVNVDAPVAYTHLDVYKRQKERRIKLNNRIEILERRIQEEDSAEVNEMVRTCLLYTSHCLTFERSESIHDRKAEK